MRRDGVLEIAKKRCNLLLGSFWLILVLALLTMFFLEKDSWFVEIDEKQIGE